MTEQTIDTTIIDLLSPEAQDSPEEEHVVERFRKSKSTQEEPEALFERVRLYASYGARVGALKLLQAELVKTTDPRRRARCYFFAGKLREMAGQYEAAARCYRAIAPESLDASERYRAHSNLGYCLNRLGQHTEAEAQCRLAIGIDPSRFNAHKNLGIALERTGRLGEAATSYRAAARTADTDERPLRHLRVLLANHPEIGLDDPELAKEVEAMHRSARGDRVELEHDEARVRQLLRDIRVGEAIESNGLQVFGLTWGARLKPIEYMTLDDALSGGHMEITEIGEQGTVPELQARNRSDLWVLLMAGEQLIGAKQNRVVNASMMVGGHTEMTMPVTCVEAGRWAYRSRTFHTSSTASHHGLRTLMSRHAYDSYRRAGRPISDQSAVWREVDRKLVLHKTDSPSRDLHQAFESQETPLKELNDQLEPRDGWSGAVFVRNGEIMGFDLFDKPTTLRKLWPKLVRAYGIDSLESNRAGSADRSEVEAWVLCVSRTAIDSFQSPGLGTDVRLEGDRMIGAMLLVDDVPVHLEAFVDEND